MEILIIHDGTKRTLDCLKNFAPDFDFDLLECEFAEAAETWLRKKAFQQIIITGESVDKRIIKEGDFVPYDFLKEISKLDFPKTRMFLVSPDNDFLNKGKLIADYFKVQAESHLLRE
jgi:hypothetical protein